VNGRVYGLSLLALAEQQEVDAQPNRKVAIAILELLCRNAPDNPALAPLHDSRYGPPEFASQGRSSSRVFKNSAGFLHALHMPAHISSAWACAGIHLVYIAAAHPCQSKAGAPRASALPISRPRFS